MDLAYWSFCEKGRTHKNKEWKYTLVVLKSIFQSANEFLFKSNAWPLKADDFPAYYRVGQFGISEQGFSKDREREIS